MVSAGPETSGRSRFVPTLPAAAGGSRWERLMQVMIR
jgi:hypothetical protein